jgi:hypothetical protein
MEVDLQSLFGLHVTWCAQLYSLAETPQHPPSPRIWTCITRALLVRKDRWQLFVTPWGRETEFHPAKNVKRLLILAKHWYLAQIIFTIHCCMYFLPAYPACLPCLPYLLPVLRVCLSCLCRCLFHFSLMLVLCACPAGLFWPSQLPFLAGPPVYLTSLSFLSYQWLLSVPLACPFYPYSGMSVSLSCPDCPSWLPVSYVYLLYSYTFIFPLVAPPPPCSVLTKNTRNPFR